MERQNVSSSNIASIGYDADNSILEIEFNNGGIYQYSGVPEGVYNGLISAGSHGTYFHNHIKDIYSFHKIK